MNAKLAACLLLLALLVGGVLYLVAGGRGGSPRAEPARGHETPAEREGALGLTPAAAGPAADSEPVAREMAPTAPALAPGLAFRGELGGLVGRVVESDAMPVPGMSVGLFEFDAALLFDGRGIGSEEPTVELGSTVTDAEGRFLLDGARAGSFHVLGIDLGGPRATFRLLDQALPHRERTDIGDVVLAPFGVLTGRVVDEAGQPVPGARVRAGSFPEEVLRVPIQDFRSASHVAVNLATMGGEGMHVLEFPAWVSALVERLPIPTTFSAADGGFRLAGVPLGEVVGGVDKPGLVGKTFGPVEVRDGELDLGALALGRGRTVRGVVEDSYGEPQAGVEVHAGAEIVPGIVAVLQPCGPTDAEGRFVLEGVPESGQVVAAARRAEHEAWGVAVSAHPENVLVELEPVVRLTVNVRDDEQKPLSGARIQLAPSGTLEGRGFSEVLMFLRGPATRQELVQEVEPGRYVIAGLASGLYQVSAHVRGLAPGHAVAQCTAEESEVTLICARGSRIELTVVDAATREPLSGARATVLRAGRLGFHELARETTDAAGGAWLGPLPPVPATGPQESGMPIETMLRVQHPRYAEHSSPLDPAALTRVVALEAGGVLAGRVHWGGAVPTRLYMLTLEHRGADGFLEVFHLPRFTLTDPLGGFRCTQLVPAEYEVRLVERFLDRDPLGLMVAEFEPPTLWRQKIEIRAGETTELVIDLTPSGQGPTARVVGRVRVDGRPLADAEVSVRGNGRVSVQTDASGRFDTGAFSVLNSAHLRIEGEVGLPGAQRQKATLHEESLTLADGEMRELELDLYPLALPVRIVDAATGQPLAEATASLQAVGQENSRGQRELSSDSAGELQLLALRPGAYQVNARAAGHGPASVHVELPPEGLREPVTVRLQGAVPCMGRVLVDTSLLGEAPSGFAYLWVRAVEGQARAGTRIQAPEYTFSLEGLAGGEYLASTWLGGRRFKDVPFTLPPEGARELVLHFTELQTED